MLRTPAWRACQSAKTDAKTALKNWSKDSSVVTSAGVYVDTVQGASGVTPACGSRCPTTGRASSGSSV